MEGCGGTRHYHVTFEFWYATDTALPKWLSELGEVAPESLGSNLMKAGPKTMPKNCVNHVKIMKKVLIYRTQYEYKRCIGSWQRFSYEEQAQIRIRCERLSTVWLSPQRSRFNSQALDTPAKRACIFFALQSQELLKIAVPCLQLMLPKHHGEKARNLPNKQTFWNQFFDFCTVFNVLY